MGRIKSEAGVGGVKKPKPKAKHDSVKTGFDGPLEAPVRKTGFNVFKQPVTLVVSSTKETIEAPADKMKKYANDTREKPLPMFWSKTFENTSAIIPIHKCDKALKEYLNRPDEYLTLSSSLPDNVTPYCSIVKSEESLISYINALTQPTSIGIVGQKEINSQKRFFDNPFFNAIPDQPLVVVCFQLPFF